MEQRLEELNDHCQQGALLEELKGLFAEMERRIAELTAEQASLAQQADAEALDLSFAVVMPPVASEVAVRGVSSQPV